MAGQRSRRRTRFWVFGGLLAAGLGAGFLFDAVELRGVSAPPQRMAEAQPDPQQTPAAPDKAEEIAAAPERPQPAQPPKPETPFDLAFNAGIAHLQVGDALAAAKSFEQARSIDPHVPETYVNLAFAYLELGRAKASVDLLQRATEIAPNMYNAYFGLAEAFDALGDRDGAKGAMRTYLHLAPEDDPFRRVAMSALWEWTEGEAAAPQPTPASLSPSEDAEAPRAEHGSGSIFDVPLATLDGEPTSLAEHRGKLIVLNVWASWCGPCRMELPSLDRLAESLDPEKAVVIGVSMDKERVFTREFLRQTGVGFRNYWDGDEAMTNGFMVVRTVPLTLVLDAEGRTLLSHEGAYDWSAPEIVGALTRLSEEGADAAREIAALEAVLR